MDPQSQKRIETLEADVELLGQAEDARIAEIKMLRRDVDRMSRILVEIITPRTLTTKGIKRSSPQQNRRK
jgi:hypothetical protein